MNDALQWIVGLMLADISKLVAGLVVLIALIEFLARFKEWL